MDHLGDALDELSAQRSIGTYPGQGLDPPLALMTNTGTGLSGIAGQQSVAHGGNPMGWACEVEERSRCGPDVDRHAPAVQNDEHGPCPRVLT